MPLDPAVHPTLFRNLNARCELRWPAIHRLQLSQRSLTSRGIPGAVLLDKADPSKVIGRTPNPILSAADEDREGYVPNVVYTCGAVRVGVDIFLPYGLADSSVCYPFVAIPEILAAME